MSNETIKPIEQYRSFMEELTRLNALLRSAELASLFDAVEENLQSGKRDLIISANKFICDVGGIPQSERAKQFRDQLPDSKVANALKKNVLAPLYYVRHDTVRTIGQILLPDSLTVLLKAFQYSLENDPLLLPALVFELGWLGYLQQWTLIEEMTHASHYLARWATLGTDLFGEFKLPRNKRETAYIEQQTRALELLREDSSLLIRAEAEYKFQELLLTLNSRNFSRAERKKAAEAFYQYPLPLDFDSIATLFRNYMEGRRKGNYVVDDLETFVSDVSRNLPPTHTR